jgi:hypothetical protein
MEHPHNMKPLPDGMSAAQYSMAVAVIKQNRRISVVAADFGCSPSTVRRNMDKFTESQRRLNK